MMVVYRGYRRINGSTQVTVIRDGIEQVLTHYVRHSPDGFEWGYGGSGPAELARCILLDHYQLPVRAAETGESQDFPVSYQDFKAEVIAPLPTDTPNNDLQWEITSRQIEEWAETQLAAHANTGGPLT